MQKVQTQELTFQSLHRPLSYRFLNSLGSSLNAIGLFSATLDLDSLLSRAKNITELSDFGDQGFHEPLECLVESLKSEARLNFVGKYLSERMLTGLLSERLRIQHYLREFPETLAEEIQKPLFVMGMPRSGTTFLFNLLCQDPNSSWIKHWELYAPSQHFFRSEPLDPTSAESDLIKKSSRDLANTKRLLPQLDQVHTINALGPDECFHLLERGFISHTFGLYANVPTYLKWIEAEFWEASTKTPMNLYQYYHRQVQVIKNLRNRTLNFQGESSETENHWVFKSPIHLWSADHISNVLPDTCFVHIHRDPLSVIPSICSFVAMGRGALSDQVDLQHIGNQVLSRWSKAINKTLEVRQQNSSLRFLDIHYKHFIEDPIEVVRKIYSYFDYDFTEKMEGNLVSYIRKPSKAGQGKHKYSLQQFGLNEEEVREIFRDYYHYISSI